MRAALPACPHRLKILVRVAVLQFKPIREATEMALLVPATVAAPRGDTILCQCLSQSSS